MGPVNQFRAAFWIALFAAGCAAQSRPAPTLDSDFRSRVMAHVRQLAACGIHEAGTSGDGCAARYVREQMKKRGLAVASEPFVFHSFDLHDAVLTVETAQAQITRLGFNPLFPEKPYRGRSGVCHRHQPRLHS